MKWIYAVLVAGVVGCKEKTAQPHTTVEKQAAAYLKEHTKQDIIDFGPAQPYLRRDSVLWVVDHYYDSLERTTQDKVDTLLQRLAVIAESGNVPLYKQVKAGLVKSSARLDSLRKVKIQLLERGDTTRIGSTIWVNRQPASPTKRVQLLVLGSGIVRQLEGR